MKDRDDELFKAMADGSRRAIVGELCRRRRRAGELARLVGLAPNAVSFHLKWLRSAGLISCERQGRCLWYGLERGTVESWLRRLGKLLGEGITEEAVAGGPGMPNAGSSVPGGRGRRGRRGGRREKAGGGAGPAAVGVEPREAAVAGSVEADEALPAELL